MNKPSKISNRAGQMEQITAAELERRFDDGEDVSAYFDWSNAVVAGLERKRVNIDFPEWMIHKLDREAKTRGVTRQSLIKMWIADRLDSQTSPHPAAE